MTDKATLGQNVPNMAEGLYLMDGIEGLLSLPQHSVDMLLTDPPYGTTRNYWDVPLPLPELWEAVKWAVPFLFLMLTVCLSFRYRPSFRRLKRSWRTFRASWGRTP